MHILIVGITWPPETFLERLIRGLVENGVEVTIACSGSPDSTWRKVTGIYWIYVPSWSGSVLLRLGRLAIMFARAAILAPDDLRRFSSSIKGKWIDRLKQWNRVLPFVGRHYDVIYFPWNLAAVAYEPLFDLSRSVVISCRGNQVNVYPHVPGRQHVIDDLRRTFQKAAAVHCVSQNILEESQIYGLDPIKARVIRPAIDPDAFYPSFDNANGKVDSLCLVTTGSLIWRKGFEDLLSAMRLIVDTGIDAHLDIIGDGPERQRVQYTIHDLDLQDRVMLLGKLSPSEVLHRLQKADAFAFASLSEGISNAVLEAMSCGLPVVTTNCGGMREAVTDGVEGFVVPTRDPISMANALIRLGQNPELRHQMGLMGRQRVLKDFRLVDQVVQFVKLFECLST